MVDAVPDSLAEDDEKDELLGCVLGLSFYKLRIIFLSQMIQMGGFDPLDADDSDIMIINQ